MLTFGALVVALVTSPPETSLPHAITLPSSFNAAKAYKLGQIHLTPLVKALELSVFISPLEL